MKDYISKTCKRKESSDILPIFYSNHISGQNDGFALWLALTKEEIIKAGPKCHNGPT